jgi:hypothetical protein
MESPGDGRQGGSGRRSRFTKLTRASLVLLDEVGQVWLPEVEQRVSQTAITPTGLGDKAQPPHRSAIGVGSEGFLRKGKGEWVGHVGLAGLRNSRGF